MPRPAKNGRGPRGCRHAHADRKAARRDRRPDCPTQEPYAQALGELQALDIDLQCREHRAVQRKVSATLLAFVEPLFMMPSGPPPEKFAEILKIAVLVWNAVTLDDHRGANYVSDVRSRLQLFDDPRGRELMLALVDDLVDRKRSAFAEDLWLVGDWEIIPQHDGGVRVRVEARTIPPQGDAPMPHRL